MSEKNSEGLSISFRVDSGFLDHNNRVITAHNVDVSSVERQHYLHKN